MSIQSLSAELANQIAAGEVVERPASVVKELVENSIDSGATKIEIDIQQGGHKQILVRDNGAGIVRDELSLALSRHATSKIKCLDDLEAIVSMGFRGEALASISSVSRLTLTSKPASQDAAWQAHAQGRDMAVEINPAAHPNGTTVDVCDLFFNTPARRRFLRTEKTEFSHIEQIVKRIALANKRIEFLLKHNGKRVKHVKPTDILAKRMTDLLGQVNSNDLIAINAETPEVTLEGVLLNPIKTDKNSDWQFSFVNHRPMRDKLINHAIKQAYELLGLEDSTPQYVLFVDVDPHDVDVNVHPAKHEVRFHQARLVHDFIVSAVKQAISTLPDTETHQFSTPEIHDSPSHGYEPVPQLSAAAKSTRSGSGGQYTSPVSRGASNAYTQLMHVNDSAAPVSKIGIVQAGRHFVAAVSDSNNCFIGSIQDLLRQKLSRELDACATSQPLLMPVALGADEKWNDKMRIALEGAHVMVEKVATKLVLKQVPAGWRAMPWSTIFGELLDADSTAMSSALVDLCSIACCDQQHVIASALDWLRALPEEHQFAVLESICNAVDVEALIRE